VIARLPGGVDRLSPTEREGVKPERHRPDRRAGDARVNVDRQQIRHLALCLGDLEDAPAALDRTCHLVQRTSMLA
jgi:hypothetical protein